MGCINSDLASSLHKRSNQSTLEKKIVLNSQVKQNDSFLITPANDNIDSPLKSSFKEKRVNSSSNNSNMKLECFKKMDKKKTQKDYVYIIGCLRDHFLFCNLSLIELEKVVKKMFYCQANVNDSICKQGDRGEYFFCLEKGVADVIVDEKVKKEVKAGQTFGDLALLYNAPRAATIRAKETCLLWAIERKDFRKTVEEIGMKEYSENRKFVDTISFFDIMTDGQKDSISSVLVLQKFAPGENIVNEGDIAASFYIIKKGTVSIIKNEKELRKLKKDDSFGELALYYQTVRDATVRAIEEVHCLALSRDSLADIFGDQIEKITYHNIQKWAFDHGEILKNLTSLQKEKIINSFATQNLEEGQIIFEKDSFPIKLVILIDGSVVKGNGEVISQRGACFGEEFLLSSNKEKIKPYEVKVSKSGIFAILSYQKFLECLGGNLEEILEQNKHSYENEMFIKKKEESKYKIDLEELICLKKLGSGSFGSVFLVKNPNNNNLYAVKCMLKYQIIEQELEKNLRDEKNIMENLNFPFIVKFHRTYKNQSHIFILEEFIHGKELHKLMRNFQAFSFPVTQFFISSIVLVIEYLHNLKIIYRDIKPENLILNSDGYLSMIDFGVSKQLKSLYTYPRTFTVIGTPHYMAPEIIQGKGYSFFVDLWSIGVCLFEFSCGNLPFGNDDDDPYHIYQEIIKNKYVINGKCADIRARNLINQLLNKIPECRLGGSYAALKANAFFDGINWDNLYNKKMKAPMIPELEDIYNPGILYQLEKTKLNLFHELMVESKYVKFSKKRPKDPHWDAIF